MNYIRVSYASAWILVFLLFCFSSPVYGKDNVRIISYGINMICQNWGDGRRARFVAQVNYRIKPHKFNIQCNDRVVYKAPVRMY